MCGGCRPIRSVSSLTDQPSCAPVRPTVPGPPADPDAGFAPSPAPVPTRRQFLAVPTRRQFLAGAVGAGALVLGGSVPTVAAAPPTHSVTVLTQNLYVGANLFSMFDLTSPDAVPGTAADLLAAVEASEYERRIAAVVDDIDRLRPHLVGLQEVAHVRVQPHSDSQQNGTPNATVDRVDFLRTLRDELTRRGLPYRVVAHVVNADIEVAAEDRTRDGRLMDVRLTDRDVILARADVAVRGSIANRYGVALTAPYGPERTVTVHRGYCAVGAVVDGRDLLFVTTHLETPVAEGVQYSQALELAATFQPVPVPVVVAGDFNSPPGSDTYRLLTEVFTDAHAVVPTDESGRTCCRPPRLATDDATLHRRIDFVLLRGDVRVQHTERVGVTPLAEPTETGPQWPSDHAGVLAGLHVTPVEQTLRRQGAAGMATARQSLRIAARQARLVSQLLARRLDRTSDEAAGHLSPLIRRARDVGDDLGDELGL